MLEVQDGPAEEEAEPLPPIWRASDELWALIAPILAESDPPKRGPQRIDQRGALDAISFRLRTGCQWNWLPKEYPDDRSAPSSTSSAVRLSSSGGTAQPVLSRWAGVLGERGPVLGVGRPLRR